MKAVVLAAGLGSRLTPLTYTIPKPLLPLKSLPLVSYTLRYLRYYGIREIFINLHHLGDKIKTALGNGRAYGVQIQYSEEPEILGTGGGIKKLEKALGPSPFLVINSDILTDFDLRRLISSHQEKQGLATLVLREDPKTDQYGAIEMDSSGKIRKILGKGMSHKASLKKFMFTGIHLIDPQVLHWIPQAGFHSIIDTYIKLILQEKDIFGLKMEGFWADLGTMEQYTQINEAMKQGNISLPYL